MMTGARFVLLAGVYLLDYCRHVARKLVGWSGPVEAERHRCIGDTEEVLRQCW